MAEKSVKTRVQMKRDSSENWGRATGFKPLEGEQIFYTDLNKVKVGKYKDGTTEEQKKSANHTDYLMLLSELDFLDADTLDGKHADEFAPADHGTHVTATTVKEALGATGAATSTKYLREDGTWVTPPDTNTVYTHPTHTARDKKLYKVHVDSQGHVDDVTEVAKADITALGIPGQDTNTTYDLAAPASKTNGNVTIDLTASGSGSGTDSVKIKGSGTTTVTTDANGVITISSPEALKNPNALSIGGKSYDGSSAISVTASDLGIANAIHFIGETTTALTDGTTTAAVTINGSSKTPVSGDVVLCGSKEFIWNGSVWKELGDGSSHALKTNTITAGNGLTDGGQIGSNPTLNVGAGNGITVTADAVAAKAGNGITVDSTGINHADTSSQASVTASGRKYITGVILDTYGHVTGLTTGTETVTDTHNSHAVISGKKADGSTDIKGSASSGDITLGDSGVTAGEYGPTANATPGYGATFNVPDIKVNSKGIVTSVVNRTVKIPASDNIDTGATSVEVTGTGNVVTAATYNATTRKLTLTKGATAVNTDTVKTEVGTQINTLISSGTADPSASTTSQYYFKYN